MSVLRYLKPVVEKFPGLANYYRYSRDAKTLKANVLYREKLGFFFNGKDTMEEGEFEPKETHIFEKIITNYDMFVNIGANTGYYVCKALKQGISTIAFEPNQLNVNILLRNIAANNFDAEFQLFPVALSDSPGVLPMFGGSTGASLVEGWAGQTSSALVPISLFDKTAAPLIEGKKCFVMIDIEGAELGCLKGANSLLASECNNDFLIEICVNEHQPKGVSVNPKLVETFEVIQSFGYVGYTVDSKMRKIELSEIKEIQSTSIDTLGVHNFLFSKSGDLINDLKSE
ncbi:FkbM family methyltransferase [Pseudomonadales bacterium]|nr:FkbM family methyltransferase [Pseudomonadales bacterium]